MAISPQTITDTLRKLKVAAKMQGKTLFIPCPDHKSGREKTASMLVNVEMGSQFRMGASHCFACGAHYASWQKLYARLTGGDPSDTPHDDGRIIDVTEGARELLFSENKVDADDFMSGMPWGDEEWRGIKGFVMRRLGARLVLHPQFNYLRAYLPVSVNHYLIGGVRANLEKRGRRNYFNTDGDWVHTSLFGYDTCRDIIKKHGYDCVVIVEGPRDTLRYQMYGIPAVGILGTSHAGNEYKFSLLANFDIENVILAYDGDEAGDIARKKSYNLLKHEYNVRKFKMEPGEDPGNQRIARIKKLRRSCEDLRN